MLRKILSMTPKLTIIFLNIIFLFAGCGEQSSLMQKTDVNARRRTPRSSADMAAYLQNQRLPSLKSVQPWENGFGKGLVLTTEHYQIYTTLLEPLVLCELPALLESCYQNYQMQLPQPVNTSVKFPVYLFTSRRQWENFTKTFAGPQAAMLVKIKAGAYYLSGVCIAYDIGRQRTFSALGHECWHQFADRHFTYRLPSWLNEGIAMQFETATNEGGLFYFEPDKNSYRLGTLKKCLEEKKTVPLQSLVAMDPGMAIGNGDYSIAAFYSQCYALIQFLKQSGLPGGLENLKRLLADGLNGNWQLTEENKKIAADRQVPLTIQWNKTVGPQLFSQYIANNFDNADKAFSDFCRRISGKN